MATRITHEDLMRYLDGELPESEAVRVEGALETSTELRRELSLFRAMKEDLGALSFQPPPAGDTVWDVVNRKVARPMGWLLVIVGSAAWVVYGVYVFFTSPGGFLEKMTPAAIVIGLVLLLAGVLREQYRAWRTDPYRDVHR